MPRESVCPDLSLPCCERLQQKLSQDVGCSRPACEPLRGFISHDPKTAETCRRSANACASLFVFAAHDSTILTSNIAEQTVRKAVIFRKLSFSTEEQTGSLDLSSSSQQLGPADDRASPQLRGSAKSWHISSQAKSSQVCSPLSKTAANGYGRWNTHTQI
jgi:hypothetical protein